MPVTVSNNFVAILSDTDVSGGQEGDLSGGSAITNISNNAVTWTYNWNSTRTNLMINIVVIGII